MSKNIVLCSDGTGNTAIKGRGTNVFRLYESIDLHGWTTDSSAPRQLAFYDDGVGTGGIKPVRLAAGAFGWGLSRNVKKLYAALARVYEPGDRIYLFGFSRGAFTVRTLAGMIAECGVISHAKCETPDRLRAAVERAYELHRQHYRTRLQKWMGRGRTRPGAAQLASGATENTAVQRFRQAHTVDEPTTIEFMGVWDTVDAVGLPFEGASRFWNEYIYCYKFPDYMLSPKVKRAAHALAIDDERRSFHPLLWDEREETHDRIEQVWFSGAHSNVGGGYPKQGVSIVALDWMLRRAERAGLRFLESDREYYREHANIHDQLYDSRAGLGMYYRYRPRDIEATCRANGVKPRVHISAVERASLATQDYAPGNMPLAAEVVLSDPAMPGAGTLRDWLEPKEMVAAHLLDRAKGPIRARCWTHALLIFTTLLVVGLGLPEASSVGSFFGNLAGVATPSGVWQLLQNLILQWFGLPLVLPGLVWFAARLATRRMQNTFASWWYPRRKNLQLELERLRDQPVEV
ncbi:MAG: DUF2235 domain-containing protein [Planctomycetota bacterium]